MLNNSEPDTVTMTPTRPPCEVADIFRLYGAEYQEQYPLSNEQRQAMRDIVQCRTAALGGHVDACDQCGGLRISYNSCRNRHCPKCGSVVKAEWLERQKAHLLPVHYFHVIFTIDHAFLPLVRVNQKAVYELLFHSAADTLKAFGRRFLGGEMGILSILHSWGQTLTEHPHLHCLVTGGALSADGRRWRATSPDFLFPIEALSAQFRDRFCRGLEKMYGQGRVQLGGQSAHLTEPARFERLLSQARGKKWQVYAKPPFGDAMQVLDYLGRYTQRIAISNHRIQDIADGRVRFSYRDYQADGQRKEMVLTAVEFIRRFLLHVLPRNFVRIRYYGLLAPRYRQRKLAQCRAILPAMPAPAPKLSRTEILTAMLGRHPDRCPMCGTGQLQPHETIPPHPSRQRWIQVVFG